MDKTAALRALKDYSAQLTQQQLLTLCGQIESGDVDGAIKGLARIVMGGGR